jgi:hypothetical protein
MSSIEIAKLTGKQHKHVLDGIRKVLDEVGIDSAGFSAQYKDSTGRALPCFNLPRQECDLIIAGYSAKYRLAIIEINSIDMPVDVSPPLYLSMAQINWSSLPPHAPDLSGRPITWHDSNLNHHYQDATHALSRRKRTAPAHNHRTK